MTAAPALLYALFVWWFATGLVLLAVLRCRRVSLLAAAILFPAALLLLARSSATTGPGPAYLAFTAAIVAWGALEIAFLAGVLTGPRPVPCPAGAIGRARFQAALGAVLYHELALLAAMAAVALVTRGGANQVGARAFLILWLMRISAELNLFLGVPVLNDELLPRPLAFLRTYFRRSAPNLFFPVALAGALLAFASLVEAAMAPDALNGSTVGTTLLATLLGLALVEHAFMLVPLPIVRLWAWGVGSTSVPPPSAPAARSLEMDAPREIDLGKGERIVATLP